MKIWAIGDLHLGFGVPGKEMSVFGPGWEHHAAKIAASWNEQIHPDDLVLIPGDISWAMRLEEAASDLTWIGRLPGTKVLIKGNHDYWWGSLKKVAQILPPSVHLIQNNAFFWRGISIGGARLWDTPEYQFGHYVVTRDNPKAKLQNTEQLIQEDLSQKLFDRELERLKMSLQSMDQSAEVRVAMTHYPPIGADLQVSRASQILEQHAIQICVFGHLHSIRPGTLPFGEARGVRYALTSCDYLDFKPLLLLHLT
ncbi:MAG: metallophosphoesterase [Chlamydiia bacterium]|nr:metallophosphoesterase [Chlamydiia bacterium]